MMVAVMDDLPHSPPPDPLAELIKSGATHIQIVERVLHANRRVDCLRRVCTIKLGGRQRKTNCLLKPLINMFVCLFV